MELGGAGEGLERNATPLQLEAYAPATERAAGLGSVSESYGVSSVLLMRSLLN